MGTIRRFIIIILSALLVLTLGSAQGCTLWTPTPQPIQTPLLEEDLKADVYIHESPVVHLKCMVTEEWRLVRCWLADKEA